MAVMDFRLPGHGRRRDDGRAHARVPGRRGRLPDRLGEPAGARRAHGRGRRRSACARTRSWRRSSPRSAGPAKSPVNLTLENTAIVLDSTADFPDAQIRFPNMRVVPLYVRFGEESFRDYVELDPHGFYERLHGARAADDLAADTAGLRLDLPRARPLRAHLLAAHLVQALGHVPERVAGRSRAAATGSASSTRSRPRSGSRCSRSPSRSCSRAARRTRRSRRSPSGYRRERRPPVHRRHARVPRQGRSHRPCPGARGQPPEREADPHDRGRRGRAAHPRARAAEGAGGVPEAVRGGDGGRSGPRVGIAHAEAAGDGRAAA